jgi:hypothetical protein
MLRPCPDEWVAYYPVSGAVGNVNIQGPDLIKPLDDVVPA